MQCPVCKIEGRIRSNRLVRRSDGTLAYKMEIVCRSKECPKYRSVIGTIYHPVKVEDDEDENNGE